MAEPSAKKRPQIKNSQVGLTEDDYQAVMRVLHSGNLRQGAVTRSFENAFQEKTNAGYAVAVNSGTAALHLAYLSLLKPGDEVLVPAFTFFATASMLVAMNAVPVFCDIDPATWTLDHASAEKMITPKTQAVVGVHLFGNTCDVNAIEKLARKFKLKMIWDAAQACGARYAGRDVAAIPDIACFSFYPSKNMTTGEGGMVTTHDEKLAKKVGLLRSHGESERYVHTEIGYNYRMTDIGAALGLGQLERLNASLERRKAVAEIYTAFFSHHPYFEIQKISDLCEPSWNYFSIALKDKAPIARDALLKLLADEGIGCAVHYPTPLHDQPCMRAYRRGSLPVSEGLAKRILSLPMHPFLGEEEVRHILHVLSGL
ncbi:MAG: DegT/DnrJ/EryC1/StrS family aminotransferase [Candidatus Omnitrophota bacterium]